MRQICTAFALVLSVIFSGCTREHLGADGVTVLSNPTDGQIVLSTFSSNYKTPGNLTVLDKYGKTVLQKSTPTAAINFQKWQANGKTRYSYMEYDTTAVALSPGLWPTTAVVLNESFQEIKRVRLLPYNGRTTADPTAVDGHEFIYLDDNHFIMLAGFQKTVSNIPSSLNPVTNCKVVAPIIQEIQDDRVVWEWDGTNYPELYRQSVEGNAFSNGNVLHDYVHMNSVFVDPTDNNLICSMRNLNQVIKISRTDGHIMWRLGGSNSDFPMTADMKFLRQHNVTLTDNNQTLLLVDNGEATERPYSRIVEFGLNQSERTIGSFKAFTVPQNIFIQYMGSAQKTGDTYFIGCGSAAKLLEVNYKTNRVNFLMNSPNNSYRAIKN
jgi:arylsulfate sulfotransferase